MLFDLHDYSSLRCARFSQYQSYNVTDKLRSHVRDVSARFVRTAYTHDGTYMGVSLWKKRRQISAALSPDRMYNSVRSLDNTVDHASRASIIGDERGTRTFCKLFFVLFHNYFVPSYFQTRRKLLQEISKVSNVESYLAFILCSRTAGSNACSSARWRISAGIRAAQQCAMRPRGDIPAGQSAKCVSDSMTFQLDKFPRFVFRSCDYAELPGDIQINVRSMLSHL